MPSVEAGAAGPLTAFPPIALQFAQKAFIVSGGRLLMVRKSASDPFHPGRWEVPGGRLEVDADLDLDDHIRREVWEEVRLKIDPGPPFHLWQWYMPDRGSRGGRARGGRIRVVAAARRCRPVTLDATLDNQDGGDHLDGCAWVPLDEVGGYDLIPSLRPVMRAFLLPPG
ncbi:NUDIX hydrolase [Spirillospora sp. NPDC127506]